VVEPILTGALLWLGGEIVAGGFGRVLDRAYTVVRGSDHSSSRRYDLSGGAELTSDVDIAVRYHGGRPRPLPVILTFQAVNDRDRGQQFPMVLTETAYVTLRRGEHLIIALVLRLATQHGVQPELHGIGWVRHWVAGNAAERITIAATAPTERLVSALGLVGSGGAPLFTLAVPEPPIAGTDIPPLVTGPAIAIGTGCRARSGNTQCPVPVFKYELCLSHLREVQDGKVVYRYDTGGRVPRWAVD
jgi:hypothetical protein